MARVRCRSGSRAAAPRAPRRSGPGAPGGGRRDDRAAPRPRGADPVGPDPRLEKFQAFFKGVEELYKKVYPDANNPNAPPVIDRFGDYHHQAAQLNQDFNAAVDGLNFSLWPEDTLKAKTFLDQYFAHTSKTGNEHIEQQYAGMPDKIAEMKEALANPLKRENLLPATSVFATRHAGMQTADTWQTKFNQEKEARTKTEVAMMQAKAEMEKRMADWEKERTTLTKSQQQQAVAPPVSTISPLYSLPPPPQQQQQQAPTSSIAAPVKPYVGFGNMDFYPAEQARASTITVGASNNPYAHLGLQTPLPPGARVVPRSNPIQQKIAAGFGISLEQRERDRLGEQMTFTARFGDWDSKR